MDSKAKEPYFSMAYRFNEVSGRPSTERMCQAPHEGPLGYRASLKPSQPSGRAPPAQFLLAGVEASEWSPWAWLSGSWARIVKRMPGRGCHAEPGRLECCRCMVPSAGGGEQGSGLRSGPHKTRDSVAQNRLTHTLRRRCTHTPSPSYSIT